MVATPAASRATVTGTPLRVKATVPVGVPVASAGLTVAENVTFSPTKDGLGALRTTVVEPGCGTVTVATFE